MVEVVEVVVVVLVLVLVVVVVVNIVTVLVEVFVVGSSVFVGSSGSSFITISPRQHSRVNK